MEFIDILFFSQIDWKSGMTAIPFGLGKTRKKERKEKKTALPGHKEIMMNTV